MTLPPPSAPLPIALPLLALLVLAARADLTRRRIPNRLVATGMVLAFSARALLEGPAGVASAAAGLLIAGGLLLPGWLLGWMGGGDVKLMAMAGAWLGAVPALAAVLAALMAGGVLALAMAARRRVLGAALIGAATLGAWAAQPQGKPPAAMTGVRMPFALAILLGAAAALWVPR